MNELKPDDVMRALQWCINGEGCQGCSWRKYGDDCIDMKCAIALLREKDAEIERLQGAVEQYEEERKYHFEMSRKRIAEAITEFAESVKMYFEIYTDDEKTHALYVRSLVDQIADEMKGKTDGNS